MPGIHLRVGHLLHACSVPNASNKDRQTTSVCHSWHYIGPPTSKRQSFLVYINERPILGPAWEAAIYITINISSSSLIEVPSLYKPMDLAFDALLGIVRKHLVERYHLLSRIYHCFNIDCARREPACEPLQLSLHIW